jgi:hypothetical protein
MVAKFSNIKVGKDVRITVNLYKKNLVIYLSVNEINSNHCKPEFNGQLQLKFHVLSPFLYSQRIIYKAMDRRLFIKFTELCYTRQQRREFQAAWSTIVKLH